MRNIVRFAFTVLLVLIPLGSGWLSPPGRQTPGIPEACGRFAFSTEEDFITQGARPPDGDSLISDGDLLGPDCLLCARNRDLVRRFDVTQDLGLDAVDVVNAASFLVAFSTELNSPNVGQFTSGDLLVTNGALLPNRALTVRFQITHDVGLDGVQLIGDLRGIATFLEEAAARSRQYWLDNPGALQNLLAEFKCDIWFSTEESVLTAAAPGFSDGDLLSARDGVIVLAQADLFAPAVPAGLAAGGVDFGLDAVALARSGDRATTQLSTEILFGGRAGFTDGDVLKIGNGVLETNEELLRCWEPKAPFLGLDALSIGPSQAPQQTFLQLIMKLFKGR